MFRIHHALPKQLLMALTAPRTHKIDLNLRASMVEQWVGVIHEFDYFPHQQAAGYDGVGPWQDDYAPPNGNLIPLLLSPWHSSARPKPVPRADPRKCCPFE